MTKTTKRAETADFETVNGDLQYKGASVSAMIAYPIPVVCYILCVSRTTLWREIAFKRLKMTRLKLVPKTELERYLDDEIAPKKQVRSPA